MRKKIVFVGLLALSALGFASNSFVQNDMVNQRGREQFRDTLIWKERNLEGLSGSNQYVEFFRPRRDEGEQKLSGHGLLIGTNSNLVSHPDIYLGTSLGYYRGREKNSKENWSEKEKFYEVNAQAAYLKNRTLALVGIGYSQMRNTPSNAKRYRDKEGHLFVELGRLYPVTANQYFYPYVGGAIYKYEGKQTQAQMDLGLRYSFYWNDKLSFQIDGNYGRKWRREERKVRQYADVAAKLSYRWYEDLEVYLQYKNRWLQKERQSMAALGFSHNF